MRRGLQTMQPPPPFARAGAAVRWPAPKLAVMDTTFKRVDWSQLWYPGRKTPFTTAEMAQAGSDAPSPTLLAVAGMNVAIIGFMVLQLAPSSQTARLTGLIAGIALLGYTAGRWLWRNPWRKPLMQATLGIALLLGLFAGGIRVRVPDREERLAAGMLVAISAVAVPVLLWFLTVWRAQQIEGRLREQAEREKAIEMARRLAAAQIEPHFLFNTLASLQHWVQTKDERAAPLLESLTGYLRATLPLFNRPLLAAREELVAVQRYLEVMQSRLGGRLSWQLDVAPGAMAALLPPGLLLTLVENAVVHGVEPQLAGGRIVVTGRRAGALVHFVVTDNGAGPPAHMHDGVGLANIRQRLALACGGAARLEVLAAPEGGCRAELQLPYRDEVSA
jgi:signal transduction histidine kinase